MPEGDSLVRLARRLQPAVGGGVISLDSDLAQLVEVDVSGAVVLRIYPQGKYLNIDFGEAGVLRSHLLMHGRWYLKSSAVRGPQRTVLRTTQGVLTATRLRRIALMPAWRVRREALSLGPDLSSAHGPEQRHTLVLAAFANLRGVSAEIGVALLRQDLVAGLGNVFKSELLFLHRLPPRLPVSSIGDDTLLTLLEDATDALLDNGVREMRHMRSEKLGRYWAYGRAGDACYRCAATLQVLKQGPLLRMTHFCPSCQQCDQDGNAVSSIASLVVR